MILAIDTGNTNIVLGCIENRKIRAVARMATDVNKTDYEYAVGMKNVLAFAGFQPESFEGAILSNVVWPLTSTLCRAVKLLTGLDTLVVGKGLKTGLDIRLDDPGQIGADLVVGAVAALHLHRPPLIVIDMGTATTVTAASITAHHSWLTRTKPKRRNPSRRRLSQKTCVRAKSSIPVSAASCGRRRQRHTSAQSTRAVSPSHTKTGKRRSP